MASVNNMSVAELEAALSEKRGRLKDLSARRAQLQKELASVEGELETLGGDAPAKSSAATGKKRGRPAGSKNKPKSGGKGAQSGKRPKNKMTMKKAVETVLADSKDGLTLSETATAVKKLGYKSKSDNFENVVYQCLYNNKKQFPKGSNGKYKVAS